MANPEQQRVSDKPGPLAGVRVLELTALIAGPSCARFLADHGADVIKIERYPQGDVSRVAFATVDQGRGPMYTQHNAGKRGMCVDLKTPAGKSLVLAMIEHVDVLIEAFTPGAMARLGLDYETVASRNPRIVYCSISGFGQTGPNASLPGYAHVAHAMSGWLALQHLHRDPPEAPRGPGIAIGDTTTGLTAFAAVCAALFKRERTGLGEHIDISLFDALFCSNDVTYQHALVTGGDVNVWYHPVHKTRDGYVTANVGPDFRAWQNVCAAMGRDELLSDERFDSGPHLMENVNAAGAIVSAWMAALDSADAIAQLQAHHIACAPVLTVDQAVDQPQVSARELTVEVDDPVYGRRRTMNSAFRYRSASSGIRGPAPRLGEHNRDVLRELLQYGEAKIDQLVKDGVVIDGTK
jgi:crotonobetainyl-CoA:carnitine CoA-transferase CaiB-like acyl-CoA transferase